MNKRIFITNGMARCGKDTFAKFLNEITPTMKYSSIDKVKDIARLCGWEVFKMNNRNFADRAADVARHYKTIYAAGAYGHIMTEENKKMLFKISSDNRRSNSANRIQNASDKTFAFDSCGLINGLLWGWHGDENENIGGAVYKKNGIPDMSAADIIKSCYDVSVNFVNMLPGEILWTHGCVGIYIGNGLAVECSMLGKCDVQITYVANIAIGTGKKCARKWIKHGKLKYVKYLAEDMKSCEKIAKEFVDGKWGTKYQAIVELEKAGYNSNLVMKIVDDIYKHNRGDYTPTKIAKEIVFYGVDWGTRKERIRRVESMGLNYRSVETMISIFKRQREEELESV